MSMRDRVQQYLDTMMTPEMNSKLHITPGTLKPPMNLASVPRMAKAVPNPDFSQMGTPEDHTPRLARALPAQQPAPNIPQPDPALLVAQLPPAFKNRFARR